MRVGGPRDRGSITTETVLLAPVILIFLLLLVAGGRIVEAQGEVSGAARDAARAASVQRDFGSAQVVAQEAAGRALDGACRPVVDLSGSEWNEGGRVEAVVTCRLNLRVVAFIGISPTVEMTGTGVAPLEQYRRIEDG